METHWCRPWEVEDVVPALWVERWRAARAAEYEASKGPKKAGGSGAAQSGGVTRTRVM